MHIKGSGAGSSIPKPRKPKEPRNPESTGGGFKINPWIMHCKQYQGKYGGSWKEVLQNARASYSHVG